MKVKIPVVFGLLLVIIGAFVGVLFINQSTSFLPRAAPEYLPRDVRLTSPSDTGFTLSWYTEAASVGFVRLGTSPSSLNTTYVDNRDQLSGNNGQFRTHYVTITGLNPETTYYYKLGSHNETLYDNQGSAYSFTTPASLSQNPPSDTAYGTVFTPAHTPAAGAIVYALLPNTAPLSALVKQDGSWAINLSQARSTELTTYAQYDVNHAPLNLLIQDGTTNDTLIVTTTGQDQPVPDITIGESVTHSDAGSHLPTPTPDPNLKSKFSLVPITVTDPEASGLTISTFPANGAITNSTQPQIQGTAPLNATITLTLQSEPVYTASIQADPSGNWQWTPPGDLNPGGHLLTLTYTDEAGKVHTLTREFVVAAASASQSGPNYTATPSATLMPTSPPSPSPLPSAMPSATPTPIERTIIPATSSSTPTVAGHTTPTLYLLLLGGLFLTGGFLIIFNR